MLWSDVDFHPGRGTLRQFAALATLFLLGASAWQYALHSRPVAAGVLAALAAATAIAGAAAPAALRWPFVSLTLAAFPVGWLMSWVVLGGLYYLLFVPIAFWFKLKGRDALDRHYDCSADTYWTAKGRVSDVRRYFRQF